MWRVILALIIAVVVGYLGLEFMAWLFKGTIGLMGDLIGLLVCALAFWVVYRLLADKVDEHKDDEANRQAVSDAYQQGLEAGRNEGRGA